MGISGWVLTPVDEAARLAAIVANLEMVAAGTATAASMNIFTEGLVLLYIHVGRRCRLYITVGNIVTAIKVQRIKYTW